MQITASALLASQQQVQRAPAQAAFEPMAFKQTAKPAADTAAPSAATARMPTGMPTPSVRPGTNLDIKV